MSEEKAEYFKQVKRISKQFVEIISTDNWDEIKKVWADLIYILSYPPRGFGKEEEARLRAEEIQSELRKLWSNRLEVLSLQKKMSRQVDMIEAYSDSL
ncbi:MAG: hypothetical protein ACFNND_05765 [Streptococcus sobrinus]